MNERTFQAAVRYGGIALAICIILNIWVVMRHVEIYRDASRADIQFQQLATQQQVVQGLLQEFATRASTDAEIAGIFKKAQGMGSTPGATSPLSNQPMAPTAPSR
jgi:hypothetical protein